MIQAGIRIYTDKDDTNTKMLKNSLILLNVAGESAVFGATIHDEDGTRKISDICNNRDLFYFSQLISFDFTPETNELEIDLGYDPTK